MGSVDLELSLTPASLPQGPQTVFIISEPVLLPTPLAI